MMGALGWGAVTSGLLVLGAYLLVTGILEKLREKRAAEWEVERARRLREDILDQRPEWRE